MRTRARPSHHPIKRRVCRRFTQNVVSEHVIFSKNLFPNGILKAVARHVRRLESGEVAWKGSCTACDPRLCLNNNLRPRLSALLFLSQRGGSFAHMCGRHQEPPSLVTSQSERVFVRIHRGGVIENGGKRCWSCVKISINSSPA